MLRLFSNWWVSIWNNSITLILFINISILNRGYFCISCVLAVNLFTFFCWRPFFLHPLLFFFSLFCVFSLTLFKSVILFCHEQSPLYFRSMLKIWVVSVRRLLQTYFQSRILVIASKPASTGRVQKKSPSVTGFQCYQAKSTNNGSGWKDGSHEAGPHWPSSCVPRSQHRSVRWWL